MNLQPVKLKCPLCNSQDVVKVIYGSPIPYKIWPNLPIGSIMMHCEGSAATHYCRACDHELWVNESGDFIAHPPKDYYAI